MSDTVYFGITELFQTSTFQDTCPQLPATLVSETFLNVLFVTWFT